ncbi:MAG: metal ABC transporter permease [Proteobacteria bacterium]|nr:metal ABC transporter permease [Pseudomonadota bacterium]
MLDDFFVRAMVGGIGLAIAVGPLGCVVVWRRMAYFGDTMAHSALLGIALGLLLDVPMMAGVFAIAVAASLALIALERIGALPTDALLGILSHSSLALGLVIVSMLTWVRVDLMSLLFGDVLALSTGDIAVIYGGGAVVLCTMALVWRSLLAGTVSHDLAEAEGMAPTAAKIVFMVLMAGVIAVSMKIVGILLITSLLIIPAATARQFSGTPERMAVLASLIGVGAVATGLAGSLRLDTSSGPSIVVAALAFFLAASLITALRRWSDAGKAAAQP